MSKLKDRKTSHVDIVLTTNWECLNHIFKRIDSLHYLMLEYNYTGSIISGKVSNATIFVDGKQIQLLDTSGNKKCSRAVYTCRFERLPLLLDWK